MSLIGKISYLETGSHSQYSHYRFLAELAMSSDVRRFNQLS